MEFPKHVPWWAADLNGLYKITMGFALAVHKNPPGIFHDYFEYDKYKYSDEYFQNLLGNYSSDVYSNFLYA